MAALETSLRAVRAEKDATAETFRRLKAENDSLVLARDSLEVDLLGVLNKLGRFPQGALLRLTPGYRKLRARYARQLHGR